MIIVDFFGFSGSGKSFSAKKISKISSKIDNSFSSISNNYRIIRLIKKIYYIFFTTLSEIKIILELQNLFIYKNKFIKIKNLLSFLYLIGFIKSHSQKTNVLLIDHGLIQCLLSCFLFSKINEYNLNNISKIISKLFSNLDSYCSYYTLVVMEHDWEKIEQRLKKREGNNVKKLIKKNKISFYKESIDNCKLVYNNISNKNFKKFDNHALSNNNYNKLIQILDKYERSS